MSLQQLGSLGEFVAAIGLMLSLIYVGLEIRQTRKLTAVEGTENRMQAWNEWSRLLLMNPSFDDVLNRGSHDLAGLNNAERRVFNHLMILRNTILIRQVGRGTQLNDRESLESARGLVRVTFTQPGVADWWRINRDGWRPEFRDFVEESLV